MTSNEIAFDHDVAVEKWRGLITEHFQTTDNERLRYMSVLAEAKAKREPSVAAFIFEGAYNNASAGITTGLMGDVLMPQTNTSVTGIESKGSGDKPSQLFSIQMHVANQTVGFDLVPVIPMTMPSLFFSYMERVYVGGTIDADAEGNPDYIRIQSKENKEANSAYRTLIDSLTYGQILGIGKTSGGAAVLVAFIQKHRITGELIVQVLKSGTVATAAFTADTTDYGKLAELNGSDNVTISKTTVSTFATAFFSATAGDKVEVDEVAIDFVDSVDTTIAGASNSDGITRKTMSRGANEKKPTSKTIGLKMWSSIIASEDIEIKAEVTKTQNRDFKAYGLDPNALLVQAGKNQITQTINEHIVDTMFELGVDTHVRMFTAQGINFNLFVGPASTPNKATSTFDAKLIGSDGVNKGSIFGNTVNSVANSSAENQATIQRKLYSRIVASSDVIANLSRYGAGDIAVLNTQLASALKDSANFQAAPMENSISQTGTLYFVGTVGGVRIYCDPRMTYGDTRVCVARKGGSDDSGLKFFAYDLASEMSTLSENTFAPVYLFTSSYKLAAVGFYPEVNYLTFSVSNGFGLWI